jgi:hypothetical protein
MMLKRDIMSRVMIKAGSWAVPPFLAFAEDHCIQLHYEQKTDSTTISNFRGLVPPYYLVLSSYNAGS